MKYAIADLHFDHEAIIGFSNRPFKTVSEMNQQLIERWNASVKNPSDEVYILGDFLIGEFGKRANDILKQLNGKKYLIKGNHEDYLNDPLFNPKNYEWIKDYCSFRYQKRKFVLFHYPILEWDGYFNSAILLYGHVHQTRQSFFENTLGYTAVNVGADMIGYAPMSLDNIIDEINLKESEL